MSLIITTPLSAIVALRERRFQKASNAQADASKKKHSSKQVSESKLLERLCRIVETGTSEGSTALVGMMYARGGGAGVSLVLISSLLDDRSEHVAFEELRGRG